MIPLETDLSISQVADVCEESVTQVYKYLKANKLPPAINQFMPRNHKRYWDASGIEEAAAIIKAEKKDQVRHKGLKTINQGGCANGNIRPRKTYTLANELLNRTIKA